MKLTICSEDVAVEMNSAFCFMKTTPHGHDVLWISYVNGVSIQVKIFYTAFEAFS